MTDLKPHKIEKKASLFQMDCFMWLRAVDECWIHAVVTDPPYGVKEYEPEQLAKRHSGKGGVWRIPPSFDGNTRAPLPRFTALNSNERKQLREFFIDWGRLIIRVLLPGGHLILASNAFLSQLVFDALVEAGLEYRGELIRLVRTLRGGDRPKNAELEFPNVCSMPRGCYEPWGLFRKPLPHKMTVADCLRTYETGGLRRYPSGKPFNDVIENERTPQRERSIVDHPSLKPQSLMRKLVYTSLPLGKGIVLDPFMGSGSTIAAAEYNGYKSIGIERSVDYFEIALKAISSLAAIEIGPIEEFKPVNLSTESLSSNLDKSNSQTSSYILPR